MTDTDFDLTNNQATNTKTLNVVIADTANPPELVVDGTHRVYEDGSVFVPIEASIVGIIQRFYLFLYLELIQHGQLQRVRITERMMLVLGMDDHLAGGYKLRWWPDICATCGFRF